MSETKPTGEQIRFRSANTGDHVLDTYLESAEIGGRTLTDLLDDLFDPSNSGAFRSDNFEFRFDSNKIQFRVGQFASSTAGFTDVTTFFAIKGTFSTSTAYNNFDVVTTSDKDVYIVHGLSTATTFSSESNFISSANTTKIVDVSEAKDWAIKTDGIVSSTGYSAKAWAIGGTGVDNQSSRGAAKDWATKTGGTVDGSDFSAKHYATTGNVAAVAGALSNINSVAGNSTNINTVAGISSNVTSVAGNSSNINAAVSNASNINAAVSNQTNINTVSGISSNVTTVAGISSDITAVANANSNISALNASGVITNIGTVAGGISNVNTLAAISTDLTSLANSLEKTYVVTVASVGGQNVFVLDGVNNPAIEMFRGNTYIFDVSNSSVATHPLGFKDGSGNTWTSGVTTTGTAGQSGAKVIFEVPTNAPSSMVYYCITHGNAMGNSITVKDSNVSLVAGSITSVNSVASNIANVNTVSGITSNLATVAGISSAVSTVSASNSNVTAVSGAITNINTVAGGLTNINTVASNLSSVNNFADVYRIANSAPTSSLNAGDLYFDTSTNLLKVYGASGWQNAGSSVNGTSERFHYDITGTPTSVTGSDANGNTLAYDAGFIDVYVNGVRMSPQDITISSGDTVTFANALTAGDEVDIVAFGTFSIANMNANNLSAGTIPDARFPATLPAISGANLTNLPVDLTSLSAANLTSGTIPDARFPATLPAISGANLTNLPVDLTSLSATNLTSGTIPDARFPSTLPAISGANLTNLDATDLTGTIASARVSGAYTGITSVGTLTSFRSTGIDDNADALAMTIDSSENVLIGKTSASTNTVGVEARPDGTLSAVKSGGGAVVFGRNSDDGTIVTFRKDGSAVGNIVSSGGDMVIGTADTGIHFHDSVDSLIPANPSTVNYRDAAIDLGTASYRFRSLHISSDINNGSNSIAFSGGAFAGNGSGNDGNIDLGRHDRRFKDLYLSGGIVFDVVAGNATSNTLDDYEEGTWTPTLSQPSNRIGTWGTTLLGTYTRVGRKVTLHCIINGSGMRFSSTSGYTAITGFPFTALQIANSTNYAGCWSGSSVAASSGGSVYLYASTMYLHSSNSGQSSTGVGNIGVSITYFAT